MPFSLPQFLPYLLNQSAEAVGRQFQTEYKERYGMLRTEWRVLFHLGLYGDLTAKQICDHASLHKSKVSRAVAALEKKRFLTRATDDADRRNENLSLTKAGLAAFRSLSASAEAYEAKLTAQLSEDEVRDLKRLLMKVSGFEPKAPK